MQSNDFISNVKWSHIQNIPLRLEFSGIPQLTLFHTITPPTSPPPPSHQYCAYNELMTQGGNVFCCGFAYTADLLRCWCHFLVLGPGEWHQCLTTALHCHGGSGGH